MFGLFRQTPRAERATVTTSGCRGYVVTLHVDGSEGPDRAVLTDRHGRARHFDTLTATRSALRRHGVRRAVLIQHHACEEISADRPGRESGLELLAGGDGSTA